ncbi:hypothetical protein UFOVP190_330 [uncultured Caudovirales phage]|uniref:Uncharacterized protein n=1 Tax=uncultured Caudovirales phage TaxID=2100421 RepID=A0A6J7WHI6_9CAUD|nr:hypothetical protein UFOVP190_330 [uncultured Caudovirales phage]
MNAKLKELVEWAEQLKRDEVSYRERLHNRYCTGDMEEEIFREKFAELIVRECIKLNGKELAMAGHSRMVDVYCEHFGIE